MRHAGSAGKGSHIDVSSSSRSWLCAALLLIVSSGACAEKHAVPDPVDPVIYGVVLDSLFQTAPGAERRGIVLDDSTMSYAREVIARAAFRRDFDSTSGDRSLVQDVEMQLQQRIPLQSIEGHLRSAAQVPFAFTDVSARRTLHEQADSLHRAQPEKYIVPVQAFWDLFHARYPDAFASVSLSAIGYSETRDHAILSVNHACGGLCGGGRIVLLRRGPRGWHIVKIRRTWVS